MAGNLLQRLQERTKQAPVEGAGTVLFTASQPPGPSIYPVTRGPWEHATAVAEPEFDVEAPEAAPEAAVPAEPEWSAAGLEASAALAAPPSPFRASVDDEPLLERSPLDPIGAEGPIADPTVDPDVALVSQRFDLPGGAENRQDIMDQFADLLGDDPSPAPPRGDVEAPALDEPIASHSIPDAPPPLPDEVAWDEIVAEEDAAPAPPPEPTA